MGYTKQNFVSGQILTAAQLNYIEDGIEKILPAIEAGTEKQLVSDTEGNLAWIDTTHGWSMETVEVYQNLQITSTGKIASPEVTLEEGQQFIATVNGQTYEGTISTYGSRGFLKIETPPIQIIGLIPGVTTNVSSKNISGTVSFSLSVIRKNYKTIDANYLSIATRPGTGESSINLNGLTWGKDLGSFAVSANGSQAKGQFSTAICGGTTAAGTEYNFSFGANSKSNANYSQAGGYSTVADSEYQITLGKYNVSDTDSKYAYILGNGTSNTSRSNAHTLDWDGNAWYAGTVEGTAMILKSPNGTRFQVTVSDDGTLSATQVAN